MIGSEENEATRDPRATPEPVSAPGHRLLRDVVIYGAGGVAIQLLLSLAVPFFTRIFSPADYGVIETTATMLAVGSLLAALGLDSASQRSYFDYGEADERPRKVVLSTAFLTLLATSVPVAAIAIVFSTELSEWLFSSDRYATAIALAFASLPIAVTANFFLEVLRLRAQPGRYTLVALLTAISGVSLALLFAGLRDGGLSGYYLGLLLGAAAGGAIGFGLVRSALAVAFDRRQLRIMLAYGLPLVPVAASAWVLQFADRFFLLRFATLDELGLYGVGVRLANLLLLAVTAFSLAWSPFMLELHQRDPAGERAARGRVLTVFVLGLCFLALSVSVYAREILRVMTPPAYEDAYQVVGLLAGSVVAIGINAVTMTEMSLKRRTMYFLRYALYAAVLNLALNLLLIPPWGMVGAAAATLLTYAALAAMYYWRAQRLERAPFELRQILVVVAVAAGLTAAGTFVRLEPLWLSVLAKLPLLVAFPVVLTVLGVLERGWVGSTISWLRTFLRYGLLGKAAPGERP